MEKEGRVLSLVGRGRRVCNSRRMSWRECCEEQERGREERECGELSSEFRRECGNRFLCFGLYVPALTLASQTSRVLMSGEGEREGEIERSDEGKGKGKRPQTRPWPF